MKLIGRERRENEASDFGLSENSQYSLMLLSWDDDKTTPNFCNDMAGKGIPY